MRIEFSLNMTCLLVSCHMHKIIIFWFCSDKEHMKPFFYSLAELEVCFTWKAQAQPFGEDLSAWQKQKEMNIFFFLYSCAWRWRSGLQSNTAQLYDPAQLPRLFIVLR